MDLEGSLEESSELARGGGSGGGGAGGSPDLATGQYDQTLPDHALQGEGAWVAWRPPCRAAAGWTAGELGVRLAGGNVSCSAHEKAFMLCLAHPAVPTVADDPGSEQQQQEQKQIMRGRRRRTRVVDEEEDDPPDAGQAQQQQQQQQQQAEPPPAAKRQRQQAEQQAAAHSLADDVEGDEDSEVRCLR